jgi:hypothetical protein
MSWVRPRFTPDGKVIVNPMIGPWEKYERGSRQWAEAVVAHLQHSCSRTQDISDLKWMLAALKEACFADPAAWTVWPEEAKDDPRRWIEMATLCTWDDLAAVVQSRLGKDEWKPFAQALANWEAEYRTSGAPEGNQNAAKEKPKTTLCDTEDCSGPPDWESAPGIRRRLLKRARAGDDQAVMIVEQLQAGVLSVNQAAIAAGMRQRYFRVPDTDDLAKVAAALRKHLAPEQCRALADALLAD